MISLTLTRFYIFLSKSWHEPECSWPQLDASCPITSCKLPLRLGAKTFTFNCKRSTRKEQHTQTRVLALYFCHTQTHTHNTVLSACYTWPLISPWCPISLDLWWPSFRSSNIKALKCPVSQPHTRARTHTQTHTVHMQLLCFSFIQLAEAPTHGSIYLHKLSSPKCKPC